MAKIILLQIVPIFTLRSKTGSIQVVQAVADIHTMMTEYTKMDLRSLRLRSNTQRFKMDPYYNNPVIVGGVWARSLADYDMYIRVIDKEKARVDKMTIDLKMFIKDMVRDEMIEKLFITCSLL